MLEVGTEKVKISDEQNGEALRDVDPKEPFHRMGLAGRTKACKERRSPVRRFFSQGVHRIVTVTGEASG